jgi:ankyrin repeat protein
MLVKSHGPLRSMCEYARCFSTVVVAKSLVLHREERGSISKLHLAAEAGRAFDMQALIERGIVGMYASTTPSALTVLHISAECGHTNLVHLLLHRGFDPFRPCALAATPTALHLAVQNGHVDAVRAFINNKVDLTHVAKAPSMLHLACRSRNSAAIVKVLLDAGLDASFRDQNGREAAEVAADGGSLTDDECLATIRLLAERGGDKSRLSLRVQELLQ